MRGVDRSYPGVQLTDTEDRLSYKYFFAHYLKLVTIAILPVGQL